MYVTIVNVTVKPEHIEDFMRASRLNHESSILESGNLAFDVLQSADDPCKFVLYESYVSERAAKAHKTTKHYLIWRDTVADWMAEPRQGTVYAGVFPEVFEEM
ncbi:MAG: antibiotic biosynthesis monooxygenase [Gammaproteobacteria bacterium]|nr:antibiotic biosynthesis monooxygenase [Gammaproteobacteria bacterium]